MSFYFSKDDILHIHSKLIDDFGGSDGIRDEGMLDSAINTPLQTFDSTDPYPTDPDKIARLSFGLVMDHPFPKERGCGKPSRPHEEKRKIRHRPGGRGTSSGYLRKVHEPSPV